MSHKSKERKELSKSQSKGEAENPSCGLFSAKVVRTGPGLYLARVEAGAQSGVWSCKVRGRLRQRLERDKDAVYIGEEVMLGWFEPRPSVVGGVKVRGASIIDSLRPRRTVLFRLAPPDHPGAALLKQVLAVNVDLMVIVIAAVLPPPKMGTINRYLLLATQAGIDAMVCINKADQVARNDVMFGQLAGGSKSAQEGREKRSDERENFEETEASAGRTCFEAVKTALLERSVPVIVTSAETGEGISRLQAALLGKTSVFVGPSGVGKTSILKKICPSLEAKTLSISAATGKGRHSTTYSSLVDIGGGYVVDIPGLRAIGFWNVDDQAVKSQFEDIEVIAENCKFNDCTHRHEPGCAVLAALADGVLSRQRYKEFMKIMEDARASRKGQERKGGKKR